VPTTSPETTESGDGGASNGNSAPSVPCSLTTTSGTADDVRVGPPESSISGIEAARVASASHDSGSSVHGEGAACTPGSAEVAPPSDACSAAKAASVSWSKIASSSPAPPRVGSANGESANGDAPVCEVSASTMSSSAIEISSRSLVRMISSEFTGTSPSGSTALIFAIRSAVENGLIRYSSARDLSFLCCSNVCGVSSDEVSTSGICLRSSWRLSLLHTAYPTLRGSTDTMMRSGRLLFAQSTACSPLPMFVTWNP
jgi:hypothetical protein